jgi:hypothetical protein
VNVHDPMLLSTRTGSLFSGVTLAVKKSPWRPNLVTERPSSKVPQLDGAAIAQRVVERALPPRPVVGPHGRLLVPPGAEP